MSNAWIRPVGPIMDHPVMQNYEFLVALNNILAPPCFEETPMMLEMMVSGRNWVRSTPQNQFLVHQPQRALDPRERDPLERGLPPVRIRTSRPHVDHFENTSLGEPDAPPQAEFRICRAQRAARRRYESTWFPANQAELNEIIEAENKERARKPERCPRPGLAYCPWLRDQSSKRSFSREPSAASSTRTSRPAASVASASAWPPFAS